jgi:hypothetical protein
MLELVGNARREINLGLAGSQMLLTCGPKASGKHGGTTNTNDTLILLLKNGFDGVLG